jgi:aspartate racemase
LAQAGATVGLIAANTPHLVFEEVQQGSPIPLISIVEATCQAAVARGMKRVGLLGTRFTTRGGFFQKVFEREGIALCVPGADEQDLMHARYMGELVPGVFRNETREEMVKIAHRMRAEDGIEGLILGGTELPLLLREATELGMPVLDTTQLHVEKAVEEVIG